MSDQDKETVDAEATPTLEERVALLERKIDLIYEFVAQQAAAQLVPQLQGQVADEFKRQLLERVTAETTEG